jgi:hypothetical protein
MILRKWHAVRTGTKGCPSFGSNGSRPDEDALRLGEIATCVRTPPYDRRDYFRRLLTQSRITGNKTATDGFLIDGACGSEQLRIPHSNRSHPLRVGVRRTSANQALL